MLLALQVDILVPVAGKQELTNFNHLFWTRTKRNLSDDHIWFSVFSRPPRSRFTRVQRLTCCVSLLFATMVANIMFYKTDSTTSPVILFSIGPIKMTLEALVTVISIIEYCK